MKKYVFCLSAIVLSFFIGIFSVNAAGSGKYYGNNIKFPDEYKVNQENKMVSPTIFDYYFLKIDKNSVSSIESAMATCQDKNYTEDEACKNAIDSLKQSQLYPNTDNWTPGNNGVFTKVGITSGSWVVWARYTDGANTYYSYKVYDVTLEQNNQNTNPTPSDNTTNNTTPNTSNNTTTTTTTNSNNPSTGISTAIYVVVPIILALGIYITIKSNKFE